MRTAAGCHIARQKGAGSLANERSEPCERPFELSVRRYRRRNFEVTEPTFLLAQTGLRTSELLASISPL